MRALAVLTIVIHEVVSLYSRSSWASALSRRIRETSSSTVARRWRKVLSSSLSTRGGGVAADPLDAPALDQPAQRLVDLRLRHQRVLGDGVPGHRLPADKPGVRSGF